MTTECPQFIAPLEITFALGLAGGGSADITVTAADVGQLGQMLTLAAPVLHELMTLPPDLVDRLISDAGPTHGDVVVLFTLLADRPEVLVRFVSIASRMPAAQIEALLPDQFAYLFAVVVQVNADFFARALPVLRAAAGKFGAVLPAQPNSTTGHDSLVS